LSTKPINILFFSSFGQTGRGGQESLFYLTSNLKKEYFNPHIIVPTLKGGLADRLKENGLFVKAINFPKVFNYKILLKIKLLWKLLKLIDRYQIDIIHTDGPRNTFYAGVAAKIKGIPLIWHVRVSQPDRYDRLLYKLSSKIIVVADVLRKRFYWDDKGNKIVTIYNGVDLLQFKRNVSSNIIRERYKICKDELLICTTARIEPMKGQKYLVQACASLKNKLNNFRILLVGEIVDDRYMRKCQDIARQAGILDRLIFTGYIENIQNVLNEIDVFVLPSLSEAFPRSTLEAMATATAAIVTNVGGNSEAVEDNVSGLIIPPGSVDALAEKIYYLWKHPGIRLKIGSEARNKTLRFFGIEQNVQNTESLYRQVLNENQ
jgi:glycosyltransferase involved in cell wall biosynthesis